MKFDTQQAENTKKDRMTKKTSFSKRISRKCRLV